MCKQVVKGYTKEFGRGLLKCHDDKLLECSGTRNKPMFCLPLKSNHLIKLNNGDTLSATVIVVRKGFSDLSSNLGRSH